MDETVEVDAPSFGATELPEHIGLADTAELDAVPAELAKKEATLADMDGSEEAQEDAEDDESSEDVSVDEVFEGDDADEQEGDVEEPRDVDDATAETEDAIEVEDESVGEESTDARPKPSISALSLPEPPGADDEDLEVEEFDYEQAGGGGAEVGDEDTDKDALTPMLSEPDDDTFTPTRSWSEDIEVPATLDAGFPIFTIGEPVEEVPVVMNFSPPEMFGRTRAEIGPQCDIFSLGNVLYFLISGELPPTSVYTRHTPAVPVRNFRPDFPIGLHSVVARATRPEPSERFQNISTMRDAFLRSCGYIEERLNRMHEPPTPRIHLAVDTHAGIAKRKRNPVNQDAVFGKISDDGKFGMVVVADGVSTASFGSGDLASDHLVKSAEQTWREILPMYLMDDHIDELRIIEQVLTRANDGIVDHVNAEHPNFAGNPHEVMGTTALVAIIRDGIVTLGALGDSRGYLQRGTSFEQITIDHNLWTLSILDGVAADSALALPHGDALARCLGTFYIEDGTLVSVNPRPDIFRFPVMSGDTLLLTTDGLLDFAGSNAISAEDNILAILLHEPNVDLACLEMILLANRGGGGDNIGLGLLRFS